MRVLVCGGRDFQDRALLARTLDTLNPQPTLIIHGAGRGTDRFAGWWASIRGVRVKAVPADWHIHGNRAGPIRNKKMLVEEKPQLVIAFPGGSGTAHMVRIAREAGVEVREIGPDGSFLPPAPPPKRRGIVGVRVDD